MGDGDSKHSSALDGYKLTVDITTPEGYFAAVAYGYCLIANGREEEGKAILEDRRLAPERQPQ